MKAANAFWDTSALVPLCIEEATTRVVERYFRTYSMVVWWASKVEANSAIARLNRMGLITRKQREESIEILNELSARWHEVLPNDEVREIACRILSAHSLKAADSFQLAAALVWCRNTPKDRVFICADRQLSDAAEQVGFSVKRIG